MFFLPDLSPEIKLSCASQTMFKPLKQTQYRIPPNMCSIGQNGNQKLEIQKLLELTQ